MSRGWLRFCELVGLLFLGAGLLALAAYMVYVGRLGEAFGAVITTVPLVIQSIRGIGQAQAMQSMADNLARSRPMKDGESE